MNRSRDFAFATAVVGGACCAWCAWLLAAQGVALYEEHLEQLQTVYGVAEHVGVHEALAVVPQWAPAQATLKYGEVHYTQLGPSIVQLSQQVRRDGVARIATRWTAWLDGAA